MCLADYRVARGIAGGRLRSMLRPRPNRRSPRSRVAAAALVAALLVVLTGCGAGGGDQTTAPAVTEASTGSALSDSGSVGMPSQDEPAGDPATDRAKIEKTIKGVLGGSDPGEICNSLVTARYVKHAYGDAAGCMKAQSKKAAAKKLEIGSISISPEAVASTAVQAKGGVYGGEQLRVVLVLQDGNWRLDSLRSNVPVGP